MEKKEYIKPEIEVVEIESVEMIASSLVFNDENVNTSNPGTQLSNGRRPGRRGEWGNLWAQGEE